MVEMLIIDSTAAAYLMQYLLFSAAFEEIQITQFS